jgi:CDP-diacylglycerol--serine O-phosphatidyltransferase
MRSLAHALVLSLPLVISGGLHMMVVRFDWLQVLKIPIHTTLLGPNKTWRGVIVMALTAALGAWLTSLVWPDAFGLWNPFVLGALLGVAYAVAELPNSYIKRRLGIAPGKRPTQNRAWFAFADQADSAVGCALVYGWALRLSALTILLLVAVGPAVHLVVNYSLYLMRLRKEPL